MKRARESEDLSTSPVKRLRKDSLPATPYTPYPPHPSESPSNPFKRKTNVDSLPSVTSFRKHIPLRFQFHRYGVGFRKGGVHRIVQVPLNYTFTHLRALIAWLFDVPAKCTNGKAGEEDYLFEVMTDATMESTLLKPGMIKHGETSVRLSNSKDPWRRRCYKDVDDLDELDGEGDDIDNGSDTEDISGDWIWADEEDYTLGHVWATGLLPDRGIIYHHHPSTQVHITVNTTKLPRRRGKSNVPYVFSARGRVHLSPRPLPRPLFTRSISHSLFSSPPRPSRIHSYTIGTIQSPDRRYGITCSPDLADDDLSDTDVDKDKDSDQDGSAQKSLDRSHPFFYHPVYSSPLKAKSRKILSPTILVDDSDDERQKDEEDEDEDEDEDESGEAYDRLINPDHWNDSYYAFGRYFLSFLDPRGRSYAHLDDEFFEEKIPYDPFENDDDEEGVGEEMYVEEESMEHLDNTPGLTTSSTRWSSSLPPSSPPAQTSPGWHHSVTLDDDDDPSPSSSIDPLSLSPNSSLELHPSIIASHYPNKKYTFTPAPPIALKHRQRLERLERKLAKGKKGIYLCENDEVDELEDEVDELEEEEEGEEVWDPFGDEEEI